MKSINISIVIPTCNRLTSLLRLIESINEQTIVPNELIIVDSSSPPINREDISCVFPVVFINETPSVCIQRNTGIRHAKGDHILLCDDDVTLPVNYLGVLTQFLIERPDEGAVSGLWAQMESDGQWHKTYPLSSVFHVFFNYLFGLSVWGEIDSEEAPLKMKGLLSTVKKRYRKLGNSLSKGGWPINTSFDKPNFQVEVSSLGVALVRRDWLLNAAFEEVLDPYGIGDNYGVCLSFPKGKKLNMIFDLDVRHYQSQQNRLKRTIAFYRRTLALHFFLHTLDRFNVRNRIWFKWSLVGQLILSIKSLNILKIKACIKLIALGILIKNPYLEGKKKGKRVVIPKL